MLRKVCRASCSTRLLTLLVLTGGLAAAVGAGAALHGLLPPGTTDLDEVAAVGLTVGGVLLAALLFAFGTARAQAQRNVAEATAALATEHEALRMAHAELAAANADLERSNEDLAAFAGLVSHDLKSPLAGVAGYLDLLHELDTDGALPAEAGSYLTKIDTGVQRMRRLIEDLLTYASTRNAAPDITRVDLRALVADVVAGHTDRFRRCGDADRLPLIHVGVLPAVAGDATMISQLMDNLIGNALKYVRPGQPARVDVLAEAGPGAPEQPGWVRIVVADRGIGIPAGQHQAIFENFHRAHRRSPYPGTGLGLPICEQIVRRHGGDIGAVDNPGGGTRFWFTLPAAGAATTAGASSPTDLVELAAGPN